MFFNKSEQPKMIIKKPPGLFILILTPVSLLVFGLSNSYAQLLDFLPSRIISVDMFFPTPATQDQNIQPSWTILEKLGEKDDELVKVPVSIGPKEIIYYENRISLLPYGTEIECSKEKGVWDDNYKVCKSVTRKRLSDKERVVGLKLLNTITGDVEIIKVNTKITTDGVKIMSPPGYQIDIVEEPNGIKWNFWYTFYKVVSPENTAVIKNNFPREITVPVSRVIKGKIKKGSKKAVQGILYVPHSEFFEQPEQEAILVKIGINHIKNDVSRAFTILKERGVKSRAFPDKLIADIDILSPRFFERLPLLEQGDFTKFKLDPAKTVKRILTRLATNGENAWQYTCNRSDACGWVQFTPPTYSDMRRFYPAALLEKDFKTGAGDHVTSIMAAILLGDSSLSGLLKRGDKKLNELILNNPVLREEFIDSSYNGNPKWAHNSLVAAISKDLPDWIYALSPTRKDSRGGLRKETRDFMTKLRYLVANDLP